MITSPQNIGDLADQVISTNSFDPSVKEVLPAKIARRSLENGVAIYASVEQLDEIRFAEEKALQRLLGVDSATLKELINDTGITDKMGSIMEAQRIKFLSALGQTVLHW